MTETYIFQLYWFWGDTSRSSFPLGNFGTRLFITERSFNLYFIDLTHFSGATTPIALDLNQHPVFEYFKGEDGFVKPMIPLPDPKYNGLRWLDALVSLNLTKEGGAPNHIFFLI